MLRDSQSRQWQAKMKKECSCVTQFCVWDAILQFWVEGAFGCMWYNAKVLTAQVGRYLNLLLNVKSETNQKSGKNWTYLSLSIWELASGSERRLIWCGFYGMTHCRSSRCTYSRSFESSNCQKWPEVEVELENTCLFWIQSWKTQIEESLVCWREEFVLKRNGRRMNEARSNLKESWLSEVLNETKNRRESKRKRRVWRSVRVFWWRIWRTRPSWYQPQEVWDKMTVWTGAVVSIPKTRGVWKSQLTKWMSGLRSLTCCFLRVFFKEKSRTWVQEVGQKRLFKALFDWTRTGDGSGLILVLEAASSMVRRRSTHMISIASNV